MARLESELGLVAVARAAWSIVVAIIASEGHTVYKRWRAPRWAIRVSHVESRLQWGGVVARNG
jgi:hypothetical protein